MNSNVPEEFLCPMTQSIMKEPVTLECGHTFERSAIISWVSIKSVCPLCKRNLPSPVATTINWSLKSLIEKFLNPNLKVETVDNHHEVQLDDDKALENLHTELSKTSAAYFEKDQEINLCLRVPKLTNAKARRHVSIVCLIDVSGSMDDVCGAAEGGKAFTRLDLVKHVLNVLVASLNYTDQLALVEFSDDSEVVLDLVNMTPENKVIAKNYIKALKTIGGTNTLPGIHKSYEEIKKAPKANLHSIILLTDGQDTIGKDLLLRGFKTIEKDPKIQFNTFGISNNIWSDCLAELALKGGGIFGFIPDQTMIGTVFINFIANTFETLGKGINLHLSKGFEFKNGNFKAEISLSYGKSRNFLIKKTSEYNSKHPLEIKIGLGNRHSNDQIEETPMITLKPEVDQNESSFKLNMARYKMLELVQHPQLPNVSLNDFESSPDINNFKEFALELKQANEQFDNNNEQIKLGIQFWSTWGQHYIRSFAYAHIHELCLNFKSPSMSVYRNPEFDEIVDKLTDLFCTLPPPIPSGFSYNEKAAVIGNMSNIMNRNNGCILGNCRIKLTNNTFKNVTDLEKNDQLENGSKVVCLIKSKYSGMLIKLNSLIITPFHPVFYENTWQFPIDIYKDNLKKSFPNPFFTLIEGHKSQLVCNLFLDKDHLANIEGFKCVTLGHGFNEDVVRHDYYGTDKIINDLKELKGWEEGLIILNDFEVMRGENNEVTGMVLNQMIQT